jgi:predicted glycoside hydrolase/deacetylase ChbG (UPF0249 family)
MKNMIINADDFGLKHSVNKAIIDLFNNQTINSTTIMANMPGFEEAVEMAHQTKITNKIGAHLVLTEGRPLTREIEHFSYLFSTEKPDRKLFARKLTFLDANQKKIIFKEYSAQINKIKTHGIPITHLDTHQHMHEMWGILQILIALLKAHKIPSMRILNNLERSALHKNKYRNFLNYYLKRRRINYSDYFGNQLDLAAQKAKIQNSSKVIEIMVHPDFNTKGEIIDRLQGSEHSLDYPGSLINNSA